MNISNLPLSLHTAKFFPIFVARIFLLFARERGFCGDTVRERVPISHETIAVLHPVLRIVIITHEILLVCGLVSDYCHSTHGVGLCGGAVRERRSFAHERGFCGGAVRERKPFAHERELSGGAVRERGPITHENFTKSRNLIIAEQMYRLYHFDMYHLQHIQMYHLRSGRFKVLKSYYFLSVFLLIESPFNSMRLALARSLSRMASASVGSDM